MEFPPVKSVKKLTSVRTALSFGALGGVAAAQEPKELPKQLSLSDAIKIAL